MRILTTLTALLLTTPALAASHELSFEVGGMANADTGWDFFGRYNNLPTVGSRIGYAVHENVAILGSWGMSHRGADVSGDFDSDTIDGYIGRTSYLTHEAALGAKVDYTFFDILAPYAHVSGVLHLGRARFDSDPYEDDNNNQLQESAVTGGLRTMGGLEVRMPFKNRNWTAGAFLELGHTFMAPIELGNWGGLDLGGFTVRSGIGLRM
jgi:hypothetical protein